MKTLFNSILSFSIVLGSLISTTQITAQNSNLWLPLGNIGIGTLLPSAKLEVKGSTLLQGLTVTAPALFQSTVTFNQTINSLGISNLTNTVINGPLRLNGIVPAIPTSLEQVEVLLRDPVNGTINAIKLPDLVGQIPGRLASLCTLGDVVSPFWAGQTNKLYSECPQVKVGIGNSNPTRSLDVSGNGYFLNSLEVAGVGNFQTDLNVGFNSVVPDFGKLTIKNTNRSVGLVIDQKNNPTAFSKLMYLEYTDPTTEVLKVQNTQTNTTSYQFEASGKMVVRSASQKIFQLDTDGLLRTRVMKVDLEQTWPDYVFEKNYVLMPLSEVKTYIDQNKHLPNIPSAAEVKAEGVNLGEMSKAMMEKIEEMTLYILQQQEEINAMKQKIAELEKKN